VLADGVAAEAEILGREALAISAEDRNARNDERKLSEERVDAERHKRRARYHTDHARARER
jgi:hypothetical protein